MEIKIGLIDKFRFIVTDITRNSISKLPSKIYSMTLDIMSINLPEGNVNINLLEYMYVNQVDGELCIIDSNVLGLGKGNEILDGTYTFVVKVNNIEEVNYSVIVLNRVQEKLTEIGELIPIDVVSTDAYIRNTQLTDDMLHYYYASSLYVRLVNLTSKEYNSKDANTLLNQLTRVLSLIDINNFVI